VALRFVPCVTREGELLLMDPHAAHERVRLEALEAALEAARAAGEGANGGAPARAATAAAWEDTRAGLERHGVAREDGPPLASRPLAAPFVLQLAAAHAAALHAHVQAVTGWGWRVEEMQAGGAASMVARGCTAMACGEEGEGEAAALRRVRVVAVPEVFGAALSRPEALEVRNGSRSITLVQRAPARGCHRQLAVWRGFVE
jgi:hypothetical protein